MKKTIIILALAAVLVSCENTLKYVYDPTDAQVTILSALSTSDTEHEIILSWTYPDKVDALPGADVTLRVNGVAHKASEVPADVPEDPDFYYYRNRFTIYRVNADLKPGDDVVFEADKSGKKARAGITVPSAPLLISVDTATVVRTIHYSSIFETDEFEQEYLDVTVKMKDIAGEDNWYTLNCYLEVESDFIYEGEDGAEYSVKQLAREFISYETFGDGILEDDYAVQKGTLLEELLPTNAMHGFSDRQFKDSDATLRFSIPSHELGRYWYVDNGYKRIESVYHLRVCLSTIDHDYYNYLRGLNNMHAYGYDVSPIIEPTMLPCNVSGGYGMVSVGSSAEKVFDLGETVELPWGGYEE